MNPIEMNFFDDKTVFADGTKPDVLDTITIQNSGVAVKGKIPMEGSGGGTDTTVMRTMTPTSAAIPATSPNTPTTDSTAPAMPEQASVISKTTRKILWGVTIALATILAIDLFKPKNK